MTELAPNPSPTEQPDQDALWAERFQHLQREALVPVQERQFLPGGLTPEELREILDPAVRNAYITQGLRPDKYGARVAKVGACMNTSQALVKEAWRGGLHAVYVENPTHTHGYVVMPTSAEELAQIETGHMPEDPLIIDPTYAQFLDAELGGYDVSDWEGNGPNEVQAQMKVGLDKGHHATEYPFYIGRASVLKHPDSGVLQHTDRVTAWDNPVAMPMA